MSEIHVRKGMEHFSSDNLDAGQSLKQAHALAFAPYAFQAAVILRDLGVLQFLQDYRETGCTGEALFDFIQGSSNSSQVLIHAGLASGLIYRNDGQYFITRTGHFFLTNETIRTNTSFMRDVCVPGASALSESLRQNAPIGLKAMGNWDTIFEGLQELPEQTRESWFAFNNHHSDAAFREALPILFEHKPVRLLDIGGSTGRFALACLDWDEHVHVGVADICLDVDHTEPGIKSAVKAGRVTLHPMDILHAASDLPSNYDTIWMSQFLPCFSEEQVMEILAKCYTVLPADGYIYIMEAFWDLQVHASAAAALQLTSLYFVNIATGSSRLYNSEDLIKMIHAAGFIITARKNSIGRGHTLLELRKV